MGCAEAFEFANREIKGAFERMLIVTELQHGVALLAILNVSKGKVVTEAGSKSVAFECIRDVSQGFLDREGKRWFGSFARLDQGRVSLLGSENCADPSDHRGVEVDRILPIPMLRGEDANLHGRKPIETPGGEHYAGDNDFLGWIGRFVLTAKSFAEALEFGRVLSWQQGARAKYP